MTVVKDKRVYTRVELADKRRATHTCMPAGSSSHTGCLRLASHALHDVRREGRTRYDSYCTLIVG